MATVARALHALVFLTSLTFLAARAPPHGDRLLHPSGCVALLPDANAPMWLALLQNEPLSADKDASRLFPGILAQAVSEFFHDVEFKQNGTLLDVHVVGATYPFEGSSDWCRLAQALAFIPQVKRVRVSLVLGTPWQGDGLGTTGYTSWDHGFNTAAVLAMHTKHTAPHSATASSTEFVELTSVAVHASGHAAHLRADFEDDLPPPDERKDNLTKLQDPRPSICREHTPIAGGVVVEVQCVEHMYQAVMAQLPLPSMAVIINPGFPLANRRSYDGVLRHLMTNNIFTAISAQRIRSPNDSIIPSGKVHRVPPNTELRLTTGAPYSGDVEALLGSGDEVAETLATIEGMEGRLLGSRSAAFQQRYQSQIDPDIIVKNIALHMFKGRVVGAAPFRMAKMQGTVDEGLEWFRKKGLHLGQLDVEVIGQLRIAVSTHFERLSQLVSANELLLGPAVGEVATLRVKLARPNLDSRAGRQQTPKLKDAPLSWSTLDWMRLCAVRNC